eukprot:m.239947 g.239947  ORF g.239947 m.239947 type:complete len:1076 (+) comp15818_c0_seq13:309-3536(+)
MADSDDEVVPPPPAMPARLWSDTGGKPSAQASTAPSSTAAPATSPEERPLTPPPEAAAKVLENNDGTCGANGDRASGSRLETPPPSVSAPDTTVATAEDEVEDDGGYLHVQAVSVPPIEGEATPSDQKMVEQREAVLARQREMEAHSVAASTLGSFADAVDMRVKEETAATLIQAAIRGYAARRLLEQQAGAIESDEESDGSVDDVEGTTNLAQVYAKLEDAVVAYDDSLPPSADCNEALERLAKSVSHTMLGLAPDGKEPVAVVAVAHQKCGALQTLLYCGASARCCTSDGSPLLAVAVSCDAPSTDIVGVLCEALDGDVDMRDRSGCTAFLRACEYGHTEIVKHMIHYGADTEAVDNVGCGCFHYAKSHEEVNDLLAALLGKSTRAGEPPGMERDLVWTRLTKAVTAADVDIQPNHEFSQIVASIPQTLLDYAPEGKEAAVVLAVRLQKVGAVKCLLENGASVSMTCRDGQSLLAICVRANPLHLGMANLLYKYGLGSLGPFDETCTIGEAILRRSDVASLAAEPREGNAFLTELQNTVWANTPEDVPVLSVQERVALRIASAQAAIGSKDDDDFEAETAAKSIQAAYRGYITRKEHQKQKAAATVIQSCYRRHAARQRVSALKSSQNEEPSMSPPRDMLAQTAVGVSDERSVQEGPPRLKFPGPPPPSSPMNPESSVATNLTNAEGGFTDSVNNPNPESVVYSIPRAKKLVRKVGFADDIATSTLANNSPSEPSSGVAQIPHLSSQPSKSSARIVQVGCEPQGTTEVPSAHVLTKARRVSYREIETAACAAAFGHQDETVIDLFREGLFTSDRMSEATRIQVLEIRLLLSKLFRDKKQLYPVAVKSPFEGESRVSTGERAECLGAYTKAKEAEDTAILFVTRLHKIDKASYAQTKDEVILLSNAALFVITPVKPKVKYRIDYRDINKISVSSFYDGILVIHSGTKSKDFGDRIYDAVNGVHSMEVVANLVRAARLSGRELLTVHCGAEIQHVITSKKNGRIRFKLFGTEGMDVIKDKTGKILQVTAPKIGNDGVDESPMGAASEGQGRAGALLRSPPQSPEAADTKQWHEIE